MGHAVNSFWEESRFIPGDYGGIQQMHSTSQKTDNALRYLQYWKEKRTFLGDLNEKRFFHSSDKMLLVLVIKYKCIKNSASLLHEVVVAAAGNK